MSTHRQVIPDPQVTADRLLRRAAESAERLLRADHRRIAAEHVLYDALERIYAPRLLISERQTMPQVNDE